MSNVSPSRRARRGTDAPYQRGNRREAAILDSLESLLEAAPLKSISNDDIAKGAGISRSTLYFYFESRGQVFGALLGRTLGELSDPNRELLAAATMDPVEVVQMVEQMLTHVLESWRRHGTVLRRAVEASDDPEVNRLWLESMRVNIDALTEWITRGRAAGVFRESPEKPVELAEALSWMVERGYYQLFSREHTEAEERRKVEIFAAIFLRTCGFE